MFFQTIALFLGGCRPPSANAEPVLLELGTHVLRRMETNHSTIVPFLHKMHKLKETKLVATYWDVRIVIPLNDPKAPPALPSDIKEPGPKALGKGQKATTSKGTKGTAAKASSSKHSKGTMEVFEVGSDGEVIGTTTVSKNKQKVYSSEKSNKQLDLLLSDTGSSFSAWSTLIKNAKSFMDQLAASKRPVPKKGTKNPPVGDPPTDLSLLSMYQSIGPRVWEMNVTKPHMQHYLCITLAYTTLHNDHFSTPMFNSSSPNTFVPSANTFRQQLVLMLGGWVKDTDNLLGLFMDRTPPAALLPDTQLQRQPSPPPGSSSTAQTSQPRNPNIFENIKDTRARNAAKAVMRGPVKDLIEWANEGKVACTQELQRDIQMLAHVCHHSAPLWQVPVFTYTVIRRKFSQPAWVLNLTLRRSYCY